MPFRLRVGPEEYSLRQALRMAAAFIMVALILCLFWFLATHPRSGGPAGFPPGWQCETAPKARLCHQLDPKPARPLP